MTFEIFTFSFMHSAIISGIAIAILVMAFTFLGNGLRDAFDVKQSTN